MAIKIQSPFVGRVKVQELEAQIDEIRSLYNKQVKAYEALVIATEDLIQQDSYVGNAYRTYQSAVEAIANKYGSTAEWGCTLTGNIIDLRAAFIISQGVKITQRDETEDAEKELKWAEDFFAYNKLDAELAQELAKEAEIEGKIAIKLQLEEAGGWRGYEKMVSVRFISWIDKKYKVKAATDDYLKYEELTWQATGESKPETLKEGEFVYNKFGGRISKPNDAQPKVMKCLTQIDDVDRALRDWREINNLFASPVPDVECETEEAAKDARDELQDFNFKIRKAFIHAKSKFNLKGPDMSGIQSLMDEIESKVKIISGNTGLPVHYLGLLDLLKVRATGGQAREMVVIGTQKEREIWKGTYTEMLEKAMDMFNKAMFEKKSKDAKLDAQKLAVEIPVYTEEQWEHIEKVLLPMNMAGVLTTKTLLQQVPGLDAKAEMQELEGKENEERERKDAEAEAMKQERDELLRQVDNQQGAFGGGNTPPFIKS